MLAKPKSLLFNWCVLRRNRFIFAGQWVTYYHANLGQSVSEYTAEALLYPVAGCSLYVKCRSHGSIGEIQRQIIYFFICNWKNSCTYLIVWYINNGIFLLTPTLIWQYYYPVGNTAGRYLLGTWPCWPAMVWIYLTFHNIRLKELNTDSLFEWMDGWMVGWLDASVRWQWPQKASRYLWSYCTYINT